MTQAGKEIYLVANWKSHKTLGEAISFLGDLSLPLLSPSTHVVLCPPSPYLFPLNEEMKKKNIKMELGVQDISPFPFGTYTGAVTAAMIQDVGKYVIVGHSERRKYFNETNQEVGNKARMALDVGLTPIVCVDEPYLETQLAFFTEDELAKIVVAYEPLAAIGSGIPDNPDHAQSVADKIIKLSQVDLPILYGGSVTSDTVKDFVDMLLINGVLVGNASLDANSWSELVKAVV